MVPEATTPHCETRLATGQSGDFEDTGFYYLFLANSYIRVITG